MKIGSLVEWNGEQLDGDLGGDLEMGHIYLVESLSEEEGEVWAELDINTPFEYNILILREVQPPQTVNINEFIKELV